LDRMRKEGFARVRIDGTTHELGDEAIAMDKKKKHDIDVYVDRLQVKPGLAGRLAESIELGLRLGEGLIKINYPDDDHEELLSEKLACVDCGISIPDIEPRSFSFNSPHGACPTCSGLGELSFFDPDRVIPDESLSLEKGAIAPWASKMVWYGPVLEALCKHYKQSMRTAWKDLPKSFRDVVLDGTGDEEIAIVFKGDGHNYKYKKPFEGVLSALDRRLKETESEQIREGLTEFQVMRPCPECGGARLRKEVRVIRVAGRAIHEVTQLSVKDCADFFAKLDLNARD